MVTIHGTELTINEEVTLRAACISMMDIVGKADPSHQKDSYMGHLRHICALLADGEDENCTVQSS